MFKKKLYFIALLLIAGLNSYAQQIKFVGTADKKYDGNKIHIYTDKIHDSTSLKDGKFVFTIPFKEPGHYFFYSAYELKTKGGYSPKGVIVTEPGTIKIQADITDFTTLKFTGSKENDLYESFASVSNKAQNKIMDDLTNKYSKEFINNPNPDTTDAKYKQLLQDYNNLSDANQKIDSARLIKFVKANPASYSAISLLNNFSRTMSAPDIEALYQLLAPKYKGTSPGKSIAGVIEAKKTIVLGKMAPEFEQADTLGNKVKLSDFRGKYTLIDFWASWCGPCRAENPNLVKTFNTYKDKGFTVLSVSLDQPGKKESWLAAIHKDNLQWTHVSDLKFWENEVAVMYGVKAIPTNVLVDREGKIIAKDLRGADLDKKIEELLGH